MVQFQQPVFKKIGCDLQPERKTDSMEVKKMAFMNELYKQRKNRQQKMVRLVTEPPENNCWMRISP